MLSQNKKTPVFWATFALILLSAALTHAARTQLPVISDHLGGTTRYLAYVSTDKPMYREGENVYLRTIFLNAGDNTPLSTDNNTVHIKITGPKSDVVHEGQAFTEGSAAGYQWQVPEGIAGGQYTAKVTSATLGVPVSERVFDIRAFRAPRLSTQIEFTRDGYGPSDTVQASVSIKRAEGGIPASASVTVIARLDGKEIYRNDGLRINDSGVLGATFNLPDHINSGEGNISFVIEDGGVVETASKSLPIVLQTMDMSFYPESGELVAGLQSRVYFQALLANGKPADVQGTIVELQGDTLSTHVLATFTSKHEGRGLFVLTPEKGKQYVAVFTAPSGITEPSALPPVKTTGAVIESQRTAYAYDEPIELSVASNITGSPTLLTLHKREALLDSQNIDSSNSNSNSNTLQHRVQTVKLDAHDAEGVLIATLWDDDMRPLAERLIYRHPRFGLNIELTLSDGPFVPGANVSVDILTTDDQGKPVEAIVGLTVTDDTVLELIEKRQQAPRLPAMVYLENDVLDFADAHVYLDSADDQAASNIDLLLGTQGWRRFVLVSYDDIKQQYPLQIARAMAEQNKPIPQFRILRRANERLELMQLAEPMAAAEMAGIDAVDQLAPPVVEVPEQLGVQQNDGMEKEEAQREIAAIEDIAMDMEIAENFKRAAPVNTHYVREFAFKANANRELNERTDFTETLYWNSGVKTGARDGRATVEFSLSDSVTTFRVMADGYGRNGALGIGDTAIASVEPFYITTKMPLNAVANDVIELPVTLVNTTAKTIDNASLRVTGNGIKSEDTVPVTLKPGERLRSVVRITTTHAGTFPITVVAQAGPYTDTVTRNLSVSSAGFPVSVNAGGLVSATTPFKTTVTIPEDVTAGSLNATATVYPSPLASMEGALSALLREPYGCFEQNSSTNYPLVMAQQYFDSHTGIDPSQIAASMGLLKTGYGKLIGFESEDSGYEWFGANPAHEALTAYGLMQFTDMAKVMHVDNTMIERTRQWLLDRRDDKGGFKRNDRALDSFGRAPAPTTDAYIVWALLESGQSPTSLELEISQIKDRAFNGNDSYIDALAANILYLSGDIISAEVLAKKLATAANDSGAVEGATTSITGSGGAALTIETTSLALLAWLRDDQRWAGQVEKSIKWLFETSKAGRFGSTQSTVLALKAINAYDAARAVPKQAGSIQLIINGEIFGEPVTFSKESKGAIELPTFTHALATGQNDIELRMNDGSKMPFALDIRYSSSLPTNADIRPVRITTTLSHTSITEGEPLELIATISTEANHVPTPIAIIGIPAGLELRHDQLKELIGSGGISAYEVRQSELVLYWRALKGGESRVIPIGLTAEVPGSYTGSASRVYPYYTDEQKDWVAGHSVEVVVR